ncbi:ubiquitin carboxyl-terminal hydrolase 23 [Impatiens glandulifera]|uniref:ubiquitin carboxyl-terminal hydrolase 23 n=1 Tax=Impatiens glandulifera TaxID=253017 RepID=UPI001FB0DCED|nr:ubiquitin carboxyl-terminal hydrolase 23 [Impatiens glandulifera]
MENPQLVTQPESQIKRDMSSDLLVSSSSGPLFHRRIEFHLANKSAFTGYINGSNASEFRLETLNPTSSIGVSTKQGSVQSGRKADGELLDSGLDPELSLSITFKRIGAGLDNLGNTCFLNSVLQCLTYTEPLAAYLQSGKHQNSCRASGFCALCSIQRHVTRALQSTGRSLAPKDLVSNLRCISRTFRNSRQEDAHEYMVNLLESMHKCCLPAGVPSESPSAYDNSLVHKIFGGRLRSQVKCMQCSFCSNKFDPFLDLSLDIYRAESLHKALLHYTAREYLDGGEKQFQCERCNQKVKALKQLTIQKAPHVLTIHLKRFGTHVGQKIDKKVQFSSTLDLKPHVTGSYDGDLKYTLYGVLVHHGWTTHSGHYSCFVRTSSGMWYSLDDSRVRQVSEKMVLQQQAYMLFYFRDRKNSNIGSSSLKVPVQNGISGGKINILHSSSAAAHVHPRFPDGLKKAPAEEPSDRKVNILKKDFTNGGKKEPLLNSSSGPATLGVGEGLPNSAPVIGLQKDATDKASTPLTSTLFVTPTESLNHSVTNVKALAKEVITHPPSATAGEHSQKEGEGKFVEIAHAPKGVSNVLSQDVDQKTRAKQKKKLVKNKFLQMNISSNLLLGATFTLRKKKHKRSKKRTVDIKNLNLGPSTSELADASVVIHKGHSKKKGSKSGQNSEADCDVRKNGHSNNNESSDILTGKESLDRLSQNGTVLANEKQNENLCEVPLLAKPFGANDSSERKEKVKTNFAMLTSGLDEITVAGWDGIDLKPSQITKTSAVKTATIGYVADEWDEEYDRGKRKKIRDTTIEFGGPNLFQEVATEKTRKATMKTTKRVKTSHSSYRKNQSRRQ